MLYPLNLNIQDKSCAVIGGGNTAIRKAKSLLDSHAKVKLISPDISDEIRDLPGVQIEERQYQRGDLKDVYLAIAATDDEAVNKAISDEAREEKVLLNVVDEPALCDFHVPSVVKRGELLISISTGGKFPYLSKRLRKKLEKEFGTEYEKYLELLGQARCKVIEKYADLKIRKEKLQNILELPLIDLLNKGQTEKAEEEISLCI
ncbi:hypothetical protein LCGC14_1375550 [marine sediment metagenome]|uniref:precorrin-2 dehydrogenase n=1 Tax=marine sediment metagenome TaxID=412755 RepID=A0A0F9MJF2_9ZZZZ|nr:bifunctional precorrin-2 dehydrogenase/sirohydrochlorin ferrochelatase [Actinomycetota bacterium]